MNLYGVITILLAIFEEGIALLTNHPVISHYSFYVSQCEDRDFGRLVKL